MKFNTCVLLAFLCIPMATNPMGARAKQGFYKICRGTNLALTFSPWLGVIVYPILKAVTTHPTLLHDAPESFKQFTHEQFRAVGVDDPTISIKVLPKTGLQTIDGNVAVVAGKSVVIGYNVLEKMGDNKDELLDREKNPQPVVMEVRRQFMDKEVTPEFANQYRALLQHEGNHIKHNDNLWNVPAQLVTPFATHKMCKVLTQMYQKGKLATAIPGFATSLKQIPAGLGKAEIIKQILNARSRYVEQRADDGIADDIEILKNHINWVKEHDEKIKKDLEAQYPDPEVRKIHQFFIDNLGTHPSGDQRVAKLEQRIAALKEKEAQQSLEKK